MTELQVVHMQLFYCDWLEWLDCKWSTCNCSTVTDWNDWTATGPHAIVHVREAIHDKSWCSSPCCFTCSTFWQNSKMVANQPFWVGSTLKLKLFFPKQQSIILQGFEKIARKLFRWSCSQTDKQTNGQKDGGEWVCRV